MDAVMSIHGTAAASFLLYAGALASRLRRPSKAANLLWTAAFVLMAIHIMLAFQFVHHWSHRSAYDETARQTAAVFGLHWGGGVFANYALLLLWAIEVLRWWRGKVSMPTQYFLAFMWLNGAVVFGHGWGRWTSLAVFIILGFLVWSQRRKGRASAV